MIAPTFKGMNMNKYVVFVKDHGVITSEIPAETEAEARLMADTFSSLFAARMSDVRAECYCIQDGKIGGRPFYTKF
jgi:hypothetical protein